MPLGHASSDVSDYDYFLSITSVDAQAAFLRERPSTGHIAKLRSAALPAKDMADILNGLTATKLYRDDRLTQLMTYICVVASLPVASSLIPNPSETPLRGPAVLCGTRCGRHGSRYGAGAVRDAMRDPVILCSDRHQL
jgi:hypothetical protein